MKQLVAWWTLGFFGLTMMSSVASVVDVAGLVPDIPLLVVVFLALRANALLTSFVALSLGYFVGRHAMAPPGLEEFAMMAVGLMTYAAAGALAGGGRAFFVFAAAGAQIAHTLVVMLLMWSTNEVVAFSSWANAALLPAALMAGFFAALLYQPMLRLEKALSDEKNTGLRWS